MLQQRQSKAVIQTPARARVHLIFFASASAMLDNIPMAPPSNLRLSHAEITKLVYKWIGVDGGYLVGFGYSSHDRFWLDVCDLAVNTSAFAGTTRECFEATLFDASAADQAAVLREVLDRYPAEDIAPESKLRSQKLQSEILSWIIRLETGQVAVPMKIESPTEFVRRALNDADSLLRSSGPQSAVDRVHTAFHAYLKALCDEIGAADLPDRPTMNNLFKALREQHPALANMGTSASEVIRIYQSMGNVLEALNAIRNNGSFAHPTSSLIGEPEAVLVINTVRTLLGYIEAKRRAVPATVALGGVPIQPELGFGGFPSGG